MSTFVESGSTFQKSKLSSILGLVEPAHGFSTIMNMKLDLVRSLMKAVADHVKLESKMNRSEK